MIGLPITFWNSNSNSPKIQRLGVEEEISWDPEESESRESLFVTL